MIGMPNWQREIALQREVEQRVDLVGAARRGDLGDAAVDASAVRGAAATRRRKICCQLGAERGDEAAARRHARAARRGSRGCANSARRSAFGLSRIGFQNGLFAMAMPAASKLMRTSSGRQPTCGCTAAPLRCAAAAASMSVSAPAGSNGLASSGAQVTGRPRRARELGVELLVGELVVGARRSDAAARPR